MDQGIPKFQKAGVIQVAPAALENARKFAGVVSGKQSELFVVCFFWYASMSITDPKTGTATHYGAGLHFGALPEAEVPKEAICETDGFRYAIQVPDKVVEAAAGKMIELNTAPPPLVKLV